MIDNPITGLYSRARWLALIACTIACTALSACGNNPPLGPSLSNVTVDNVSLQPTAGNASLCCCRLLGRARNLNSVPVHVTIKFSAFDNQQIDPIGTIIYFIKELQPNQTHDIEASGFLFSCAASRDIKMEIDVNGLDEVVRE